MRVIEASIRIEDRASSTVILERIGHEDFEPTTIVTDIEDLNDDDAFWLATDDYLIILVTKDQHENVGEFLLAGPDNTVYNTLKEWQDDWA